MNAIPDTKSLLMPTKSVFEVRLTKGHSPNISEMWAHITLYGLQNIPNKLKTVHFFVTKVLKGVCWTIISPCKKNRYSKYTDSHLALVCSTCSSAFYPTFPHTHTPTDGLELDNLGLVSCPRATCTPVQGNHGKSKNKPSFPTNNTHFS